MDALPTRPEWACRLQALAQTGLTYARDPFDIERYGTIRRMAAEMPAGSADEAAVFEAEFDFRRCVACLPFVTE